MWTFLIVTVWALVAGYGFGNHVCAVILNSCPQNLKKNLAYLALASLGWPVVLIAFYSAKIYLTLTEPA